MIRFSDIPYTSLLGRFLRWWLRWIPPEAIVPVLQGSLRGARWIVGAQTHGMWLGSYELDKVNALVSVLRVGDVFYDVGANVGFYSLLAARMVGTDGHVYAFEPLPRNLRFLSRHIRMNTCQNITIVPCAVANCTSKRYFTVPNSSTGHLSKEGDLEVETITLDDFLFDRHARPPDIIKADIEGAEIEMLEGASRCLTECRPLLFLAVHSAQLYAGVYELSRRYGYIIRTLDWSVAEPESYISELVMLPEEYRLGSR